MVYYWTTTEENLLREILQHRGLTYNNIYNMFNTIALHLFEKDNSLGGTPFYSNEFPLLTTGNKEARSLKGIKNHSIAIRKMDPDLPQVSIMVHYNENSDKYQVLKTTITEKMVDYIDALKPESIREDGHSLSGGRIIDDLSLNGGGVDEGSRYLNNITVNGINKQISNINNNNNGKNMER